MAALASAFSHSQGLVDRLEITCSYYYHLFQASSQVFQPVRVTSTLISTTGTISSPYHGPVFAAKPSGILACIRYVCLYLFTLQVIHRECLYISTSF